MRLVKRSKLKDMSEVALTTKLFKLEENAHKPKVKKRMKAILDELYNRRAGDLQLDEKTDDELLNLLDTTDPDDLAVSTGILTVLTGRGFKIELGG